MKSKDDNKNAADALYEAAEQISTTPTDDLIKVAELLGNDKEQLEKIKRLRKLLDKTLELKGGKAVAYHY
ncbi:hypothetical protein ACRTDP_16995 [Vibrio alginolyticus]|uniref:hypothetical protein n=1 Tax=Vibrio alginolyticus TaxID=663 RepID=UPI003D7ED0DB|nr:hypothetical protein [Vibrio parahaemolyticus]